MRSTAPILMESCSPPGVGRAQRTPAFSSTMAPFESCFFCHGNGATFTDKTVEFFVTSGGVLSPHTTCGRCHSASRRTERGRPTMSCSLRSCINDHADASARRRPSRRQQWPNRRHVRPVGHLDRSTQGTTLGTGYLCVGCHGNAVERARLRRQRAWRDPGSCTTPSNTRPLQATTLHPGNVTGHQVLGRRFFRLEPRRLAGAWYSGGGPSRLLPGHLSLRDQRRVAPFQGGR